MSKRKKNFLLQLSVLFLALMFTSCTTTKNVIYFNDLSPADSLTLSIAKIAFETPIQKNDQLSINVGGSNPIDLLAINSANGMAVGVLGAGIGQGTMGYLVEADGKIKLPYIGKVSAEGLTRLQLEDTLTLLFKEYTKNPIVNVRFLNYNYSVMGEVNNRGRFNMVNERTTILEAISVAGDLTEFGKRENVLIFREVNGVRSFVRVSLLSKDLFKSPYFYLKTNDVVYVEPVKATFISRSGVPQYLGIIAIGLSLLITIINLRR